MTHNITLLSQCVNGLIFFFLSYIFRGMIYRTKSKFRTLACSEPEACSLVHLDPWQTSTMESFAKIVVGYNYFRNISFSCSPPPPPPSLLKIYWCSLSQTQHYANVLGNESINLFQQKVTKVRQTVLYRISYLSFFLIHYVSGIVKYTKIVSIGLYLLLAYIEKLISTECYFFSYFGLSI